MSSAQISSRENPAVIFAWMSWIRPVTKSALVSFFSRRVDIDLSAAFAVLRCSVLSAMLLSSLYTASVFDDRENPKINLQNLLLE